MNLKFIIGIVIVLVVVLIIVLWAGYDIDPMDENGTNATGETSDEILEQLPYEVSVGERTVVLDTETLENASREEFSQANPPFAIEEGEDPIQYLERYLGEVLNESFVEDQPEFFNYQASFYSLAGDQDGISAIMRVSDIPDDSVGQAEVRIEFIHSGETWMIDWYGERVFCRRPQPGNWQPAEVLCP